MFQLLVTKSRKLLRRIMPKFSDKKMEEDYLSLRKSMVKDFKICILFLISLNIVGGIFAAVRSSYIELYFSAGTTIGLIMAICIQIRFPKYTHFILLIVSISYNIIRLVLVYFTINHQTKTRVYIAGYSLASLQLILLIRLVKTSYQLIAVGVALVLRFVYLNVVVLPGSFDASIFIRNVIIDIFVVYTICGQDIIFRKVYQNFVQKNEELLKFKELLSDYLPQSLIVVNSEANNMLFYNKAFQSTLAEAIESPEPSSVRKDSKPNFSSFIVEKSTIRETGSINSTMAFLDESQQATSLKEVLESLTSESCLHIKSLSLAASLTRENNRKLFEVTIQKVKWDSADGTAILFNDITYQESLIALKMANINKDNVIATVSHELRTPLNGIIGILNITEKKVNDPEVIEYLSLCKDNAQLLLSLVNSILDLQQISAGKLKLNPTSFDIRKVVKSICQLFYFQCNQKSIYLEADIHDDVPALISSDGNRLKQIFINLIGNAIKFTQKGGIKIEVMRHPTVLNSLQISVSDSGIGIKKEDHKHLFKMYSRIEDGESVNKSGVGLGLTISNALAILLSGSEENTGIHVESEYGMGTKFFFTIQTNLEEIEKVQRMQSEQLDLSLRKRLTMASTEPDDGFTRGLLLKKAEACVEKKTYEHEEEDLTCLQQNDCDEFFVPNDLDSKIAIYASFKKIRTPNKPDISDGNHQNQIPASQAKQASSEEKLLIQTAKLQSDMKKQEPTTESLMENLRPDLHVLIVDDNPFNLLVAKSLLQDLGCRITTALGGQEAIEIVKKNVSEGLAFKVIFMDCQMPIMDGFETTRILLRMMKNNEIPETPIYGWTANNSEEDVKRCYEAGMAGHLSKPASKANIIKIISKL